MLKSIKRRLKPKQNPTGPSETSIHNDRILERLWPAGTWKLQEDFIRKDADWHAQVDLLWAFFFEVDDKNRKYFAKTFGRLYSSAQNQTIYMKMPENWKPSKKSYLKYYVENRYDIKYYNYMVEELEKLGNIRP